jgi:hypothetical protein
MVVTVRKQVYGDPWTRGDKTWGFKVLGGAPEVIRTPGLLIRSQTLYPAELRAHILISATADSIQLTYRRSS